MAATVGAQELPAVLQRLGTTQLKFGLLLDLCLAAYWDHELSPEEKKELDELGSGLGASGEQVDAVLQLAAKLSKGQDFQSELEATAALEIPREALAMACGLEGDKPF